MADINIERTTYIQIGAETPISTGIESGSMHLTKILSPSEDLTFGTFASSMFEVRLFGISDVSGESIKVYQVENNVQKDLFTGFVDSAKLDESGYYRDIIAYDAFSYLTNVNVASWFNGLWTNRETMAYADMLKSLFTANNLDYDSSIFTTTNFKGEAVAGKIEFTQISFKDMVKFLAEPNGAILYIDGSGTVKAWFRGSASEKDITGKYDKNKSKFEETTFPNYSKVILNDVSGEEIDSAENSNIEVDNPYVISYSPILSTDYSTATLLSKFLTNTGTEADEYTACDVHMIVSDLSLELGDKIETDKGISYITEINLYGSMLIEQELICRGRYAIEEVKQDYNPQFNYLENRIAETAADLQEQIDNIEFSDDYIEELGAFNEAIANASGLRVITIHNTADDTYKRYFYAPAQGQTSMAGSQFVFTMGSNGFAWTDNWEGQADGTNEGQTQWTSGISANGNMILKILNAYKISADIIEGGVLQIKDGNGNVVHSFNNNNGSASIGNGGITYDTTNGLQISSQVIIGAAQTAVEEAVADLDIKSVTDQVVEYAISTNGSEAPEGSGGSAGVDYPEERFYYTSYTNYTQSEINAIVASLENDWSWYNNDFGNLYNSIGVSDWGTNYPYLYTFLVTSNGDGTASIRNFEFVSTFGNTGRQNDVLETQKLYLIWNKDVSNSQSNYNEFKSYVEEINPSEHLGTPIALWALNIQELTSTNKYLVSFSRKVYGDGHVEVLNITNEFVRGQSGSSFTETKDYYISSETIVGNTQQAWNQLIAVGADVWPYEKFSYNYFDDEYKYVYKINVTLSLSGTSVTRTVNTLQLFATFGDAPAVAATWSQTMPNIAANKGKYLWTRTTTTYSDGSDFVSYSASYIANDGQNGDPGQPGQPGSSVTVTGQTVEYTITNSGTNVPSSSSVSWSTSVPNIAATENKGKYLWTRTTVSYSSGSNAVTYSPSYIANDGQNGQDGQDGQNGQNGAPGKGISSITQYYYATVNQNDTKPNVGTTSGSNSWKTLPSETGFAQGKPYLWTYTKTTYTDTTSVTTDPYIVGVWGQDGDAGTAVQGRGIVSIEPQYVLSTSNSTSNRPGDGAGWSADMPVYQDASGGARQYYWQRDKITYDRALNGSTVSYTTPVLLQGVNSTMLAVNELNADFARVIVKENNQTYIDGAKIYTGSVTAASIAAYEALIRNLMANTVDVTGDITITSPDVPQSPSSALLDEIAYEMYGKSYTQLIIEDIGKATAVSFIANFRKYLDQSKFSVVNSAKDTSTVIYPGDIYCTAQNGDLSRYGYDASIPGNLDVVGAGQIGENLNVGGSATITTTLNVGSSITASKIGVNGNLLVSGNISGLETGVISFQLTPSKKLDRQTVYFTKNYTSVPNVQLTPMCTISTTPIECRLEADPNTNLFICLVRMPELTQNADVKVYWVAIP